MTLCVSTIKTAPTRSLQTYGTNIMRTLFVIFSITLLSTTAIGQTTAIPDANFEQLLILMGADTGMPDGSVPTANISALTYLSVYGWSIGDLTGIEDFTSLITLNCSDITQGSLDLSQNTALETLICNNTQLTSLNINQNVLLDYLELQFNPLLSSINTNSNVLLTEFYCNNNQLFNIDVSQNVNLIKLNCSKNPLTGLNVIQNVSLKELWCEYNQLITLDVTQNTVLERLECDSNQLNAIDLSQNGNLTYLSIFWNQLLNLDVTANVLLNFLDCSQNQITSLNLTQNTALMTLISDNNHPNLDLTQNLMLRSLLLDYNQISTLDLTQNTELLSLSCTNNPITSIDLSQNTNLKYVNFFRSKLTSLDLSNNPALKTIDVFENELTCLNLKNGNPTNLQPFNVTMVGNPNLTCIEIDDVAWATTNLTNIDPQHFFSTGCTISCAVGLEENNLPEYSFYPNPTSSSFNIDLGKVKQGIKATLTNSLGQVILSENYTSTNFINIDIDAPNGIYFLKLEVDGNIITKKIIKK